MTKAPLMMVALAVATTGIAAPAKAQDDDMPRVTVPYSDLNLASVDGRKRLDTRVRSAIREVCQTEPRPTLRQRAIEQACAADAIRSTQVQVAALVNGHNARLAATKQPVLAGP